MYTLPLDLIDIERSAREDAISSRYFVPEFEKFNCEIIMVPPVLGLSPPLDRSFSFMAQRLADHGFSTTVVSFPGQPGNQGKFSVIRSCIQLSYYLRLISRPFVTFGICSGALAALAGCVKNSHATAVFCWDMSTRIRYSTERVTLLATRYGINFCEYSALIPVQALDFISEVHAPIAFAFPQRSYYTDLVEQKELAMAAANGKTLCIADVGHCPGEPRGSEHLFVMILENWLTSVLDN